jgi:hypothetical protein
VRIADDPPRTVSIRDLAGKQQLCSVQPGLILRRQSETLASQWFDSPLTSRYGRVQTLYLEVMV